MITLNLISPEKKEEIQIKITYQVIKNMVAVILLFTTIVAIILVIAKTMLEKNFQKVINDTTLVSQSHSGFPREIKKVNDQLRAIKKIQEDYLSFSEKILATTSLIPEGVQLKILNFNKTKATATFAGRALSRDNLLILKKNLENSTLFSEVELPLANILTKENVDFQLEVKFNIP